MQRSEVIDYLQVQLSSLCYRDRGFPFTVLQLSPRMRPCNDAPRIRFPSGWTIQYPKAVGFGYQNLTYLHGFYRCLRMALHIQKLHRVQCLCVDSRPVGHACELVRKQSISTFPLESCLTRRLGMPV